MRRSWTLAVVFFVALVTVSCSDDDDAPKIAGSYEFQEEKTNFGSGIIALDDEANDDGNGVNVYVHYIQFNSVGISSNGASGKGSYVAFSLMTTNKTALAAGTYVDKSGFADMGVDFAHMQTDYDAAEDSGVMYGIRDTEVKVETAGDGVYTITFSGKAYDFEEGSSNAELFDVSGTFTGKLTDISGN
jgi:hypothetical protein